jgi:hypothetical protein
MKKLALSDVRGPRLYAGFRDDLRKRVIELKRARRFAVGPTVTLVFENRATVLFQIEEMCRAESIVEPAKIAEEVAVYNALLPDDGEIAATLFVEITDPSQLQHLLDELVGLQDHVWLDVGERSVRATFDPEQFAADKLAAVQYLRFPLDEAARAAVASEGTALKLRIDHPHYSHQVALGEPGRKQLASDLT